MLTACLYCPQVAKNILLAAGLSHTAFAMCGSPQNNQWMELQTPVFSLCGLDVLRLLFLTLYLSLPPSVSLEYLDNMEKLDLSYNQLVSVGSGVFRGLSRLRQLYLHNNRLNVVQQGSLDMLPGLEVHK